jgi:hypothetical protein
MSAENIISKNEKRKEFSEKSAAISAKLLDVATQIVAGGVDSTLRNEVIELRNEVIELLQKTYHDFNKARLAAGVAAGALNGVAAVISSYEKNPVADLLVYAKFFAEKQASLIKESVTELG